MLVDPPLGWQYGFPKKLPKTVDNIFDWLVENGYPKHLIEEYGQYFYIRYIGEKCDSE